jgi:hypothetical protein
MSPPSRFQKTDPWMRRLQNGSDGETARLISIKTALANGSLGEKQDAPQSGIFCFYSRSKRKRFSSKYHFIWRATFLLLDIAEFVGAVRGFLISGLAIPCVLAMTGDGWAETWRVEGEGVGVLLG